MYHTHTHTHLLVIGALLACLCSPLGRASAQDWGSAVGDILSLIPMDGLDFDGFDDYPSFRPRGSYLPSDSYYRNNGGRYSAQPYTSVRTPSNTVPTPVLEPLKNENFSITSYRPTPQEIGDIQQGARDENNDVIRQFASLIPSNDALASEIQTSSISKSKRAEILASTQTGDPIRLLKLFFAPTAEGTPQEHESLLQQAIARQQLKAVLASANVGTLNQTQLQGLKKAMMPFLASTGGAPAQVALTKADELVNKLIGNSTIIKLLDSAEPGTTAIATGPGSTIIVSPVFPQGTVVSLGLSSAIVGSMNPAAGTFVGSGSVLQAAGAPIGMGQPVPETTRKDIGGGVYIKNSADTPVSYVLNQRHKFTMQSGYFQHLAGGATWTIVFDRGGSHGEARYELAGSYRFELTDSGWDLFRVTFDTTIDNTANTSDFNYVLNNQTHVVKAGESKDHDDLTFPPLVRFDNGNDEIRRKALTDGRYPVLIAEDDHSLELFAAGGQSGIQREFVQEAIKRDPLRLFAEPETSSDDEGLFGSSNVADRSGWIVADEPTSDIFD